MDKKEACSEITLTAIQNIPEINPGDDVSSIISQCLSKQGCRLRNNDAIVVAQKIISKSENRFIDLKTIEPSEEAIKLANLFIDNFKKYITDQPELIDAGPVIRLEQQEA